MKELTQQKEELLKESKANASTADSVKAQIDLLVKVRTVTSSVGVAYLASHAYRVLPLFCTTVRYGYPEKGR